MVKLPLIQTQNYLLRIAEQKDVNDIVNYFKSNKKHLLPWQPTTPDVFFTEKYWAEKVNFDKVEFMDQRSLRLFIFKKDPQQVTGSINFSNFERGGFQCCRLGYGLGKAHEGKGVMTEALGGAVEFIFNQMNFHRIEANYIPRNERSGRLLERLGFEKHGVAKNYLRIDGVWEDHILTSLTNEHWKEL